MDQRRFIEIMYNNKIIASVVLILLGGAVAGVGTWAYFSDKDRSTSNTVEAGTLDITIDGTNDDVESSFSLTNAKPGDATSHNYTLRNVGSIEADHVEVTIGYDENDTRSEPSDSELNEELNANETAQHIEVTTYEYQNESGATVQNLLSGVSDGNNNGIKDLEDVVDQAAFTDNLAPPQANSGNATHLVISVRFANDDGAFNGTDEDIMADGIDVRIHFTLNQESSQ
ncbi:hypothetical protein BRC82_08485 [Halobacteriales archaeon QS_1_67_19]|nr:MAG: hypothetical protein BRC82_08485 [Halobacteriales archaeon QS_1_67_19]